MAGLVVAHSLCADFDVTVAVIGSGMAGLVVAHSLCADFDVTVFEGAKSLGLAG
ncbi:hypothetical protein T484DRAFT_1801264 [Baffinella frigidus]|nr:hypothetical protein T484DRAFT_1801264 [Cryptophyta sp. CCMP2293]